MSIKKFFDNGGKIRIVLPNRDNEQMIQTINGRLPDHNIDSIKENITNTVLLLNRIKEESTNAQALVETTFTNEMIWYCGIKFDNKHLVLSPYEHKRYVGVLSPAIVIDIKKEVELGNWFDKDFFKLFQGT